MAGSNFERRPGGGRVPLQRRTCEQSRADSIQCAGRAANGPGPGNEKVSGCCRTAQARLACIKFFCYQNLLGSKLFGKGEQMATLEPSAAIEQQGIVNKVYQALFSPARYDVKPTDREDRKSVV